jgi:hypothetical protein
MTSPRHAGVRAGARRRRHLVPVAAVSVGAVLAGGIAYAASIAVSPATAGASQSAVGSCTAGSVTTSYPTPTDSGSGYTIASITVTLTSGDATSCAGKKIYIGLTDGTTVLTAGPAGGTTVVSGTLAYSISLAGFTAGKSMADVTKTDIAIQ